MSSTTTLPPILDTLNIGITLHDPDDGDILAVNDRLEQLLGYPEAEFRRMTVEDYTTASTGLGPDDVRTRIQAAASGEPQTVELQVERTTGEYRWVSIHFTQTTIEGDSYVVGQLTEVTEYKVREQLLGLLNRVIRHNLRNDMNILIGYADRVKTAIENDQLEEEVETILDIAAEVGTLSDSLDQIERIAKPDATQREPTNLETVVRRCGANARSEYPGADIAIDAPDDVWVSADNGLRYAIDNAIDNAVTHNDRDSPQVTLSVTIDSESGHGVVQVADNGPPIPPVEIDVLRDGQQVDSTYHGSGVGLWVMKWCVDSLGGALSFEQNSPRGNVVEVAIPTVAGSIDEPP